MAENNGKNTFVRGEASIALDDIYAKYTKLVPKDIQYFAPIYYPIAMVEMNLDELTFEDFETVQFAILRLFAIGITDADVISKTLGLSKNYVSKLLRLLGGYGHINEKGLTKLGQDSLDAGKKITKSQVWQKFQLDALNGTLMRVDQAITDNMIVDREDTSLTIGHLNYLDGMSLSDISTQLAKNKSDDYIRQKSGILNTNVVSINDVRCTEIKYARCYMVKVAACSEPIVFAKRYDASKKDVKDRFSWQPFCIKDGTLIRKYGLESNTPLSTPVASTYISQMFEMIVERSKGVELSKEIPFALRKVYPFNEAGISIVSVGDIPVVNVSEKAFTRFNSWVLNFLIGIQNDKEYLVTNENLFGHIISLRSESYDLKKAARTLDSLTLIYSRDDIYKRMKDKFRDYEGNNLILDILSEAEKMQK